MLSAFLNIAVALLLLAYPVIVYLGLSQGALQEVSYLLFVILFLRLGLLLFAKKGAKWLLPICILGLLLISYSLLKQTDTSLKLYPVMVNGVMLISFFVTLWQKQSMVERLARLQEPNLDQRGIHYTRSVTKVWCAFFLLNGSIALYTSLYASMQWWSLYNGLIAYVLIGTLMAGEWLFRRWYKKQGEQHG